MAGLARYVSTQVRRSVLKGRSFVHTAFFEEVAHSTYILRARGRRPFGSASCVMVSAVRVRVICGRLALHERSVMR